MATFNLTINIPFGTVPHQPGERGVLAKALADAAHEIGATAATSGTLRHDGSEIGSWDYAPVATD